MRETLAIEDPDISTHAPRTGSDRLSSATRSIWANFNPRSPHGERRGCSTTKSRGLLFQPTLPARGATRRQQLIYHRLCISTHAPRTGSDFDLFFAHAVNGRFQPTLPARGATRLIVSSRLARRISTHAPRTGSDAATANTAARSRFQPTLPARGATPVEFTAHQDGLISTHAPRTGSDAAASSACHSDKISTHAPRTGSDWGGQGICLIAKRFQPTLPARGATANAADVSRASMISTHAPRTGSDRDIAPAGRAWIVFQPTLPARGATRCHRRTTPLPQYFNPRSPHGERLLFQLCIRPL